MSKGPLQKQRGNSCGGQTPTGGSGVGRVKRSHRRGGGRKHMERFQKGGGILAGIKTSVIIKRSL